MSLRDLVAFSAGALGGHRLRTSLSFLGVAIGVASVVLLTSLGEGARLYVTGEFTALGTNLVIVLPGKTETTGITPFVSGTPRDLTLADAEAIVRRVPRVRRVAPLSIGTAPVRFGERRRDVVVAGTTAAFLEVRNIGMRIGRYLPEGDSERGQKLCVIGAKVQQELFGAQNPLGEVLRVGQERFRIIGVVAPRGVSIGMDLDDIVQIPVARAMKMFNQSGLFRILVQVRTYEEIPAAKAAVLDVLRARHNGEDDMTLLTQDSVLATFGRILAILTAALVGIAAISLTVAGIGIMNVMLVSVSERRREIGLLKALGVTQRQIVSVFLVEAAILSTGGGAAGLAFAFGAAGLMRRVFPDFPVEPPAWAVVAAIGVSISVGLAFGAMPARRAARLDPIAALARR